MQRFGPVSVVRVRTTPVAGQYQLTACECDHALHGVPYELLMYCRPQATCVAAFVCQSAAIDAIFEPGSACGMPVAPPSGLTAR
jgi:hypothetical protein